MDTPKDKHPSKSSFCDTSDNFEGAEKQIKLSGYLKPENEADKLHLNDNTDTERCQENQGRNATHTTNVKIQSTSTLNQSKQQFIGNSISKDSVQQKLPKPKEFQELQFMGCSNLMDTNSESRSDFPLLFSTETAIPSETMGIMPELMVSDRSFIEIPGNITTEKYQETTTFIISTEIGETTESKTSNVFSKQNIQDNITSVKKEELYQVKLRTTQEQSEDWTREKLTHQQDKQLQQSEDAQVLSDKLLKKEQNQQELIGSTFECLKCSIFSQELEVQVSQEIDWESRQLNLLKSIPTHSKFSDTIFPTSLSTTTLELTIQPQESSILSGVHSPVQAHQTQEAEQDSNTQLHHSGERDLDALLKLNPASVLSNNLKELSDEDFELFLGDSLWQDTLGRLKQSRRESLGQDTKGSGYLSFPTLTSNESSTSRPAGQTKCEKWFKDNGLIPNGSQLGTKAIAKMMGFPSLWFEGLTEQYSLNQTTPSQTEPQEESEVDTSQVEQLPQPKQPSPSAESSTSTRLLGGDKNSPLQKDKSSSLKLSIPCLVKKPKQPEVKGVIQKDEGDRFLVDVDGKEISVSKLFVYPDFDKSSSKKCKTAAKPNKKVSDTSAECSSKISTPSICEAVSFRTNCSSKKRRHKGEGSGHIYYRTVTRNSKDYRQAYYQWRENGKQRTKYIPKKLLCRVEEAESRKLPIADILILLGGMDKCSSKSSSTSMSAIEEKVIDDSDECSSKVITPSKKRRTKGKGAGYIECKPLKKNGKEYKQYWYHYEEWREGDKPNGMASRRKSKKSRYIPKRLVAKVEKMETEKVSVREILFVLIGKDKGGQK